MWLAYGQSKLANLLFAFELQRKADRAGARLVSVGCNPGYAATNLHVRRAADAGVGGTRVAVGFVQPHVRGKRRPGIAADALRRDRAGSARR